MGKKFKYLGILKKSKLLGDNGTIQTIIFVCDLSMTYHKITNMYIYIYILMEIATFSDDQTKSRNS